MHTAMSPGSPPRFDPTVIERYAQQLYRKSHSVRTGFAFVGAAVGVVFGAAPVSPLGSYLPVPGSFGPATILLGGLLGALLGYVVGEGRSFRIQLQAQLMLFQLQLERNTHVLAAPEPAGAPPAPSAEEPVIPVQRARPPAVEPLPLLSPTFAAQPEPAAPPLLPPVSP